MSDIETTIRQKYPSDEVIVYGLHSGESADLLAEFIEQTGVTYPILQDQSTLWNLEFPAGVGYPYPRDVVIDKKGIIRSIKNSFSIGETTTLIDELLAEPFP